MPNQATPQPDSQELFQRQRRLRRRVRLWLILMLGMLGVALVWLLPLAIRFPAASVPATVAAAFRYARVRRRVGRDATPLSTGAREHVQVVTALWGIVGGAVGYGTLAALGIGAPVPEATVGWRIFGGAVFGAAAGAAAGAFIPVVGLVAMLRNHKRAA